MAEQRQIAVLPEPGDVVALVGRGAVNFARRHRFISGGYLLGLAAIVFVGTGIPLSAQQHSEYQRIMNSIDLQAEYDASRDYWDTYQAYRATKGWFWNCDSLCQRNYDRYKRAETNLIRIRREGEARMSDAKRVAGVFSEIGVGEVKER